MINLRYHIVSITAVFLALGIGVALGGTFLDKYTVDQLDTNIHSAETRIRATESDNSALKASLDQVNGRDQQLLLQGSQELMNGYLAHVPVLVIAAPGVDKTSLATLRATLDGAGAEFKGTLTYTDKFQLDDKAAAALSDQLNLTSTAIGSVRRTVLRRLSAAMLEAATPLPGDSSDRTTTTSTTTTTTPLVPPPTLPGGLPESTTTAPRKPAPPDTPKVVVRDQPEILTVLRNDGYLTYQPADGGSADDQLLTRDGYRYVFVTGPTPAVPDRQVLLPLLRDMSTDGPVPVVVASAAVGDDAETTRDAAIQPIRNDQALQDVVSTVDDLESFPGLAATVLALKQLDNDVHGHYGVGDGVSALLPSGS